MKITNSKIILGTVQFGLDYGINNSIGKPSEKQVFEMLEYAAHAGINILDTADAYGNATKLIGKFNQANIGSFVINTKFNKSDLSLRKQLQATLKSLQLQQVNTYFYHSFEDFRQYPELLDELTVLKDEKLIENIGLSVYDNMEFKFAIESEKIDVIQLPFNLLDNHAQRGDLLKQAKINDKEIQVRSVFLQGLFFKSLSEVPSKLTQLIPYLQKIQDIVRKYNLTTERLALQYVMQQSHIDHIIIGTDNIGQLRRNLHSTQGNLPLEVIQAVNEIKVKEDVLLYPKNWN